MRKEYVILLLIAVLAGSSHPVSKLVLREMTPFQLSLLRATTAFVTLAVIVLATGRLSDLRRLTWKSLALTVVAGLFGFAFTNILGNMALRSIPAAVNGLLLNTSPVFIALSAPLLLHERLTRRIALGTLVALLGIVLVMFSGSGFENWRALSWVGALLSLGAGICWALYTISGRPLMRAFDPISISMLMSLCGAALLFGVVISSDGFGQVATASLQAKLMVAYLGLVVTALAFTLWYYCLKSLPAAQVGAFQYPVPVFAVILSSLILGEPITAQLVVGMGLIITGVWLVQR